MGALVKAATDTLKGRRKPDGMKKKMRDTQAHETGENMPTRIKRPMPMVRGR